MNGTEIAALIIKIIKWILLLMIIGYSYTGYRGIRNVGCWDTIAASVRTPAVLIGVLFLMMSADDILAQFNLISAKKDEKKAVAQAAEVIAEADMEEDSDDETDDDEE